jgi:hypothetical protein
MMGGFITGARYLPIIAIKLIVVQKLNMAELYIHPLVWSPFGDKD